MSLITKMINTFQFAHPKTSGTVKSGIASDATGQT